MSLAAGTTAMPIMIGLVVGVVAFLAWATAAVRRQRAEATVAVEAVTSPAAARPAEVRVVMRPHYTVAAPDDAAVFAAMALRVRPPLPFPVPAPVEIAPERVPASAGFPRSA